MIVRAILGKHLLTLEGQAMASEDRNDSFNSTEVDRLIWVKDRILTCNFYSCNFLWPLELFPNKILRIIDKAHSHS